MADKQTRAQASFVRQAMSRRDFLKVSGAGLAGAALLSTAGYSPGASAGGKTLTIGNIGWDEDVAIAHLTKVILEGDLGYQQVKIEKRGVDALFQGVANGELDTFQDVWLPRTHQSYWQQYGDKLERLNSWYQGDASLGLTVPDYVDAQSIDDLNRYPDRFNKRIVGIEPGAGEMKIMREDVIPGYNLSNYKLVPSTTPKMLTELEDALQHREPIVVTLYKPHWAFTVYRIRYLDDPKGLLSQQRERIYSVVRQGLKADKPDAYTLLDAIRLTPNQLGQLESAINVASSPEDGANAWLNGDRPFGGNRGLNRDVVQPWIDAARRARQKA